MISYLGYVHCTIRKKEAFFIIGKTREHFVLTRIQLQSHQAADYIIKLSIMKSSPFYWPNSCLAALLFCHRIPPLLDIPCSGSDVVLTALKYSRAYCFLYTSDISEAVSRNTEGMADPVEPFWGPQTSYLKYVLLTSKI